MKRTFYERHALFILMVVFFLIPFGLRGSRMAINNMRNEVKDWLPDRFKETKELEIFQKHFWGEGFIVVSWEGCRGTLDDDRFKWFVDKFFPELPPSQREQAKELYGDPSTFVDRDLQLYVRRLESSSPLSERDFVGNRLGLYSTGNYHQDWGGENEKWLRGDGKQWYYVLPTGEIYQWNGTDTALTALARTVRRKIAGPMTLDGTLVASLGDTDGPWYYEQPRRLEADVFKSVITGPSVLSDLVREEGAVPGDPDAGIERLKGWLFGPDGKQTCLVATLSDRGRTNIHRAVGRGLLGKPRGKLMEMAAESGLQIPPAPSALPPLIDKLFEEPEVAGGPMIHLGGPPVDNVAIDEEGQATLVRLAGISGLLGIIISWFSFRNVAVVVMLSFVGFISAVASLAFVWWGGSILDAVLMSMPSLVYVLGLSGAVHIVNYYRDTVDHKGFPGDIGEAVRMGWKPCVLAAITTALGLISLATSDVVPIRKFGLFAAVGVVFTLTLIFTFLPAAISLWPPKDFSSRGRMDRDGKGFSEYCTAFWSRIGMFVVRRHGLVAVTCLLIMLVAAFGLPKMKTSVQLIKLFDQKSKIIADYTWLEKHLGKLVPMELLVWIRPDAMRMSELNDVDQRATGTDHGDEDTLSEPPSGVTAERYALNFLERMELTEYIRRSVDAHFGPGHGDITGKAMMASTFVPTPPGLGGSTVNSSRRGAYSRRLAGYRDALYKSDCYRIDQETGTEIWRMSLRLSGMADVDYGKFVVELKKAIEPVMSAYQIRREVLVGLDRTRGESGFRGARVLYLGVPFGKSGFAHRLLADVSPAASEESAPEPNINQTLVFSATLNSLLRNASLVARDWHDPRFELPADFSEELSNFDAVVLVGDDPRYDVEMLSRNSKLFVDARNHVYPNDPTAPTALALNQPIGTMYTGLVPIVYKAQRTLLRSLINSTFQAFVAISIVMMLVLRSPLAGLVSMAPNVFPVILIFGYMGLAGILVDIGTMMTASVAMGVAVDDTVHFLTWFRRGLDDGMERKSAIMLAYDRCSNAMTQTTLIAGLGLSVFGFSSFTPTQRFGVLMLTLMVAALIGDLIFLPAMLAGPLGRVFKPRRPASHAAPPRAEEELSEREKSTPPISLRSHARNTRIEGAHHTRDSS